jgi:chitinase
LGYVSRPAARIALGFLLSGTAVWAANQPPVVSITSPAPGTSVIGPTTIELEASASSPDSTISSITYFKGATKLATETSPPYQYDWKNAVAGTYSITAVAKDALGVSVLTTRS